MGERVGAGGDAGEFDIAIGSLQESMVAWGQAGAICVLAATDPGSMPNFPNTPGWYDDVSDGSFD